MDGASIVADGPFCTGFFSLTQSIGEAGHVLLAVLLSIPYRLKAQDLFQVSNSYIIYVKIPWIVPVLVFLWI